MCTLVTRTWKLAASTLRFVGMPPYYQLHTWLPFLFEAASSPQPIKPSPLQDVDTPLSQLSHLSHRVRAVCLPPSCDRCPTGACVDLVTSSSPTRRLPARAISEPTVTCDSATGAITALIITGRDCDRGGPLLLQGWRRRKHHRHVAIRVPSLWDGHSTTLSSPLPSHRYCVVIGSWPPLSSPSRNVMIMSSREHLYLATASTSSPLHIIDTPGIGIFIFVSGKSNPHVTV